MHLERATLAQCRTPVILTFWEAEAGRLEVQAQPQQPSEMLCQKEKREKRDGECHPVGRSWAQSPELKKIKDKAVKLYAGAGWSSGAPGGEAARSLDMVRTELDGAPRVPCALEAGGTRAGLRLPASGRHHVNCMGPLAPSSLLSAVSGDTKPHLGITFAPALGIPWHLSSCGSCCYHAVKGLAPGSHHTVHS